MAVMELEEGNFTGRSSFMQARGKPFVLWLSIGREDADLRDERERVRQLSIVERVERVLRSAAELQEHALNAIKRTQATREEYEALNRREDQIKKLALPLLPPLAVRHKLNFPLLVEVVTPGAKDEAGKVGPAVHSSRKATKAEMLGALAKRDDDLGAAVREYQSLKVGADREIGRLVLPDDYVPVPEERREKIQQAVQYVCRKLGMAEREITTRDVVFLWPFAKGERNAELAGKCRWAVLKYIDMSGERHDQIRNLILSAEVSDPVPKFEPKE